MGMITALKKIDAEKEGLLVLTEEDIKNIQSVLLEMLIELDLLCDRFDIQWGLAGGSMLGAIRHHGFIPWDEDVDIHLERKEFIKLKKAILSDEEFMTKYHLKCPGDKDYIYHFPRIYKKGTVFKDPQTTNKMPNEIFIDIFILENIPNKRIHRIIHGLQCNFYLAAISAMRIKACSHTLFEFTKNSPNVQKEIKKRVKASLLFSYRSLESWIERGDRCFAKINNNKTIDVGDPTGAKHYFGEIYKREDICIFKRVPFAGVELPIPFGAEKILCQRYGTNYMELPPENKIEKHTIIELNTGVD